MSWITGLADKAENILNTIDKNAATALQIPPSTDVTLDTMRRNLSSSTLSLKSALSTPIKKSATVTGSISAKSDNVGMTDSIESNEKLETMFASRSSAIVSSKAGETVAIDMGQEENVSMAGSGYNDFTIGMGKAIPKTESSISLSACATSELAAFKIALAEVTSERDELRLRLSSLNRDIENAGIKQRAQDLEIVALRLTEERDQAQQELVETQTANSAYVHSISELEANLSKLQQEYLEMAQKLQMQMKEIDHQRLELHEYRTKAQRALQLKDSLIAELKSSGGGVINAANATASTDESELRLLQMEFDALKQEHQQFHDENSNLRAQLEDIRRDWNTFNKQHESQLRASRTNEEALRKELRLERERTLATESEQRVLSQELSKLRQQLSNQMSNLQDKEKLVQQLRAEKIGKNNSFNGNEMISDYGNRIKVLTQTLVDKQNSVENITAERNALRIQLEKMQDKLQQTSYNQNSNINKAPRNALLSNSTDDVKAQFPLLLKENPFDNRVARRVKRAYSSLDSAGIRLGAFLRRYPLMRVFVLMYVGLLHIWVMFVLLSSTPN